MKETLITIVLTFVFTIALFVAINPPRPCCKCHAPTITLRYYPKSQQSYQMCPFGHSEFVKPLVNF